MLQGTSHPLTANMDRQGTPIDPTRSTTFHSRLPSTDSSDSLKTTIQLTATS